MFSNYLRIALRSLARHRGYAFINVFGLAIGMAACLLMLAFVRHEWAYDALHDDDVHRVDIRAVTPHGEVARKAGQPLPLAPALAAELPEVAAATRIVAGRATVRADVGPAPADGGGGTVPNVGRGADESIAAPVTSEEVTFTDASFFDVFGFNLLAGQGRLRPGAIVVTSSTARRHFGEADPIGRSLALSFGGGETSFEVIGVAADPPAASSLQFGILAPVEAWSSFGDMESSWSSWVANVFVRLDGAAAADDLPLEAFTEAHYGPMIRTWEILQWLSSDEGAFRLELTPVSEIHFRPDVEQAIGDVVNPTYLYVILALAVAVLLVACINFAALAASRSTQRAREVGLRKVLGAARGQLVRQFWGEAFLMSAVSLVAGVALAEAFLPQLNGLLGKRIDIDYFGDAAVPAILFGLVIFTGLAAGAYPAAYLSRFRPVEAFRGGGDGAGRGRNRWIEGMVVAQFACSLFCIAALLVGAGQLDYLKTTHVGFDREQVIVVPTGTTVTDESERLLEVIRNELGASDAVAGISAASFSFHHDLSWNSFNVGDRGHTVYVSRVDPSFLDVMGMRVADGRGFSSQLEGDAADAVVVNEALVRDFELEDPVGQRLHDLVGIERPRVIGVVEDYHFQSMHRAIEPAALFTGSSMPYKYLYVRARPGAASEAVAAIGAVWSAVAPDRPFSYYFLDDDFDRLYRTEEQWQRMIGWAAVLTLLIACMGLFALAAFATERRTKEIGIRKVLGASVAEVVGLLTVDFVRLVGVAALVALPAAYVVAGRWLEGYAYRIDLGLGYFAAAALIGLAIAVLTVAAQSARAAVADPVETLRYE